ncbi:hypothetical protein QYH69_13815 [Paraburkholderia sp. SARCC-3016]|jgi:Zn-dependent protease|uniref:hypothetical protein n=1 Tax=Paraburkholderia sp. SARCC-3016 TaxID=3058611 RepID=UPI0028073961|nr:hypothetical protein [Paraburkholderia sp. SARCC-3016]MDQ7978322.1 hypothetical protein [Paraburkholderia sp. SARCC-3016]
MPSPQGSVVAISSASATVFSIGMAFLGYWGINEPGGWTRADRLIAALALIGFACLGVVPWMATAPVEPDTPDARMRIARHLFMAGAAFIWIAIVVAVVLI